MTDAVEFWNRREESVRVAIEAVDAELIEGAFALKSPGNPGEYIGKWTDFLDTPSNTRSDTHSAREPVVTIPAGGRKIFRFSIAIPSDATFRDYWGGMTVREIVSQGSSWRIGVRTLLRIRAPNADANQLLPQVGGGVSYAPELTLFLQDLMQQMPEHLIIEFQLFSKLSSQLFPAPSPQLSPPRFP